MDTNLNLTSLTPEMPRRKRGRPRSRDSQDRQLGRTKGRLSDADQTTILAYLIHHKDLAEKGLTAAVAQRSLAPSHPAFQGQCQYWESVLSAIKWMMSRVPFRQGYLLPSETPPTEPKPE